MPLHTAPPPPAVDEPDEPPVEPPDDTALADLATRVTRLEHRLAAAGAALITDHDGSTPQ